MITRNGSMLLGGAGLLAKSMSQMPVADNYLVDTAGVHLSGSDTALSAYQFNTMLPPANVNFDAPTNSYTSGIMLLPGSGQTAPSVSDNNLDSAILSLSPSSPSASVDANGNPIYSCTYRNDTSETVTVHELGLYSKSTSYTKIVSTDVPSLVVLIGRSLLDNPVNILPSAEYTFEFTIKFN